MLRHRGQGHGPRREHKGEEDSTLLIDATMKSPMPPLALPTRPYMEAGRTLWEKLGLPELRPETPWHGYSLGDWSKAWEKCRRARRRGRLARKTGVAPWSGRFPPTCHRRLRCET